MVLILKPLRTYFERWNQATRKRIRKCAIKLLEKSSRFFISTYTYIALLLKWTWLYILWRLNLISPPRNGIPNRLLNFKTVFRWRNMTDSLSSKIQRQEAKQEGMKRDKICQLKPFGEEKKRCRRSGERNTKYHSFWRDRNSQNWEVPLKEFWGDTS